jgi:hypothetical protein
VTETLESAERAEDAEGAAVTERAAETESTGKVERSPLILVRATIHLPGLRLGDEALIDPSLPYERDCLNAGYLVRV